MHFMTILQLKGAPTGRTAVALGTVRGFAVAINRFYLLAVRTKNREENHAQRYTALQTQHTTKVRMVVKPLVAEVVEMFTSNCLGLGLLATPR